MERMHFFDPEEKIKRRRVVERERTPEHGPRGPEVVRIRQVIQQIIGAPIGDPGLPPTRKDRFRQLETILEAEPQRDTSGNLRYLVTSGLAVELVTGFERPHHDIDLVIMDAENADCWDIIGTDNVTPGEYWADMRFEPAYLEDTARTAKTRHDKKSPVVEVVHPGIVMVQKSSNAWGRPPRQKDRDDVEAIARHWKEAEAYTREWNPIVRHAIDALPRQQRAITLERVRNVLSR